MSHVGKKVYLSGRIANVSYEEAVALRAGITSVLVEAEMIPLDPMRGKGFIASSNTEENDKFISRNTWLNTIKQRDFDDCRNADVIVVLSGDNPSWGTAFEFAYSSLVLSKPVIVISSDFANVVGWAEMHATYICDSVEKAVDYMIEYLFLEE